MYEDKAPSLILWFFDSRGNAALCIMFITVSAHPGLRIGGFSEGANSTALPDWVDASVADWITLTVSQMDAAWGPAEQVARGSLVFVHIPP